MYMYIYIYIYIYKSFIYIYMYIYIYLYIYIYIYIYSIYVLVYRLRIDRMDERRPSKWYIYNGAGHIEDNGYIYIGMAIFNGADIMVCGQWWTSI